MNSSLKLPYVSIVGRPNVGKSTLFNRLIGWRKAIEYAEPGTTRDPIFEPFVIQKKSCWLIDTGGLGFDKKDSFSKQIHGEVADLLTKSEVILFVVDAHDSAHALDHSITDMLRRSKKPVILVVNKIDTEKQEEGLCDFYELGFDPVMAISAQHNLGITALQKKIAEFLPDPLEEIPKFKQAVRIALVGEPNSGKSTYFNAIIGAHRSIVSPIAGTTRDYVEEWLIQNEEALCLTDTGGLRRSKRFTTGIAYLSALRSKKIISRSDLVILMVDAATGPQRETRNIYNMIKKDRTPCLVLINKWDLAHNIEQSKYTEALRKAFPTINKSHILYISALSKRNVSNSFRQALDIVKSSQVQISELELKNFLARLKQHPVLGPLQPLRVKQVCVEPPTFVIRFKRRKHMTTSKHRTLINLLTKTYYGPSVPISVKVR